MSAVPRMPGRAIQPAPSKLPAVAPRVRWLEIRGFGSESGANQFIDHQLSQGFACSRTRQGLGWQVVVLAYE